MSHPACGVRSQRWLALFVVCVALSALLAPASAFAGLTATQEARLAPSYSLPFGSRFGNSVAKSGSTIAVGDRLASSVSVFSGGGGSWSETARLESGSGNFGHDIGLSGSSVMGWANNQGFTVWSPSAGVWSSTAIDVGTNFASSGEVAIEGDLAVVGPVFFGGPSYDVVLRRVNGGWSPIGQIPTGDGRAAISGSQIVVNDGANGVLRFYTAGASSVTEDQQLAYTDPGAGGFPLFYGGRISMDGDTVVLGSPAANTATIVRHIGGTWAIEQTITQATGNFGSGVSVKGDTVAVGAPYAVVGGDALGSVFLYQRGDGSWPQAGQIDSSVGMKVDNQGNTTGPGFGVSVALADNELLVGADHELDSSDSMSGAAYLYSLASSPSTPPAGYVPAGSSVTVTDTATGGVFVFDNVTTAGTLTVTKTAAPTPSPTGFTLVGDACYDVTFTGTFTGGVTLALPSGSSASGLKMYHFSGGAWSDVTTGIDSGAQTVTGRTTSFSPFGIYGPSGSGSGTATATAYSSVPASSGWSLVLLGVLGVGVVGWKLRLSA
jgi:hypothetical protein